MAPHLLATPAIVIGRRKEGTRRVIISHFQVERETRQVQFFGHAFVSFVLLRLVAAFAVVFALRLVAAITVRIETLSSRDACSAGLIFGLRVCYALGSATSSMLSRVCWRLALPSLPWNALDSCEMGYCNKQADQVGARAVQGATLSVGDRRCHPRVGASSPRPGE